MTDKDFNECVRLHADGLYRFIFKNIRNAEDAKDIVQTAYEKMWLKRGNVDASSAKAYLFTVAYHELIDQVRKRKTIIEIKEEAYYHSVNDHKKLLELALSRLTDLQRSLILLKDWEGYSYDEIAKITGLNTAQVKVYLHRARLQVKKFLGKPQDIFEAA